MHPVEAIYRRLDVRKDLLLPVNALLRPSAKSMLLAHLWRTGQGKQVPHLAGWIQSA